MTVTNVDEVVQSTTIEKLMLRDSLNESLETIGLKREKIKAVAKIMIVVIAVSGGVAVSILVSNPIILPILGGLGFLCTRNINLRKVKKKGKERKDIKMKIEDLNRSL